MLTLMSSEHEDLFKKIDQRRLPQHVAVIMDGNGRWAKKRGLPRLLGHQAGAESVREIVRACGELGIKALTLYAFSTENWQRPEAEVRGLMSLLILTLRREIPELRRNNVRLQAVGRLERLPASVQKALQKAAESLKDNTGLILNLALNYGGRQEILDAVRSLLKEGVRDVDEDMFSRRLYTAGLPDPDLLIRTSGEYRLSNFLLWQTAYTEIHICPDFWPDFRRKQFYTAILDYQSRERRFGAL
jgi:undecaprenyl diphosphate synthase